jgi:hypothetical protein
MSTIPDNFNALLLRIPIAEALTQAGFPIKAKTLATMATRGGGPPYRLFGQRAVYRWGDALQWAQARMTAPRRSTAEADIDKVAAARAFEAEIASGEAAVAACITAGGHVGGGDVGIAGATTEPMPRRRTLPGKSTNSSVVS